MQIWFISDYTVKVQWLNFDLVPILEVKIELAAGIWVMLYVHPFKFLPFSFISNVFITIHENAN